MSAFEDAAEARMAAAKAAQAAYKADTAAVNAANPVLDEQTKIAGAREALAAAAKVGIPTVAKTETAAERLARIKAERETTQSGANPDNPMPTADPGKGMHWANYGGVWKAYPDNAASAGASAGAGASASAGAGAGAGAGTGATDGATATKDLIATQNQAAIDASNKAARQSAFDVLYNEFNKYGLGSMVDAIKGLITDSNVNPSQFSLALQNTDAYKQRFSANQDRIKAGLQALNPAQYIALEDQYQNVMRNYGLPSSYYAKDSMGTQAGFNKFIANDVSATELEDRIATAQQRVINSNPEVLQALKQFYPDINNADILAYTLDPQNGLDQIKRKVTAAEIGGAALAQGLQAQGGTAESLAGLGITKSQAQQGYTNIAEMLPRGSQLSDIYNQGPYNQQTAEAEVFNTAGAAQATQKRKKLTALETAQFSGSSGVGSLNRDRAVSNYMLGQPGAGSY